MRKALIIIPYFGEFPPEFPFWLASCGRNGGDGYDWLLITDQPMTGISVPDNVRVLKYTFDEMRQEIQRHFDFRIVLPRPQKLCDYRPAYGLIFRTYTAGYRYWGHCDMDMVFGHLDHFLKNPIEEQFEKLLTLGHLSLYLNNEKMRNAFQMHCEGCLYYKDVFTTEAGMTFDEDGWPPTAPLKGLKTLLEKSTIRVWEAPSSFADVSIGTYSIEKLNMPGEHHPEIAIYEIKDGQVIYHYRSAGKTASIEQLYVHMQKRPWEIKTQNTENFLIVPPGVLSDWHADWQQNRYRGG